MSRETLLRSRCTDRDWAIWQERARVDDVWAATRVHEDRVVAALRALERFALGERGYIGVSWGKDSCAVLLLSLRLGLDWPIVHVRIDPVANPDCAPTRDAWLARHPLLAARYHEVAVRCAPRLSTGRYDTNAAYRAGFGEAARRFGERRVSGVRAEESGARAVAMRSAGRGDRDDRTARPIGYWRGEDVFALLRGEPLCPAYPCSRDGLLERERVRTNNLWGLYGEGHGRRDWEERYYSAELARIRERHAADLHSASTSVTTDAPARAGRTPAG